MTGSSQASSDIEDMVVSLRCKAQYVCLGAATGLLVGLSLPRCKAQCVSGSDH